jgi:alginate O-acetyltransferase complex protein AlgI
MPLFFAAYFLARPSWRNAVLLLASLLFYYVGAGAFSLVLVASVVFNHVIARWIACGIAPGLLLAVGVIGNLLPLLYYKYWTFLLRTTGDVLTFFAATPTFTIAHIVLPAGISFFTFQGISYLVDVYRRDVAPARNLVDFGMYHTLFPQLIAGPIVRFRQIESAVVVRPITLAMVHAGIVRFMLGVAKKIILADNAGYIADHIFALPHGELSTSVAWLGTIAYTLQIYFDFSGYSDMAIGMGLMLGFRFPENFDQPYRSRSITEFWRRWHMTLSRWFRDYVYIPLGGNRHGPLRTYVNLFVVFFLCGLWHGAGWPFVVWGLFHGGLLVAERILYGKAGSPLPWFAGQAATLLLVMIGWVFFRAPTLADAVFHIGAMFGGGAAGPVPFALSFYLTPDRITFLLIAAVVAVFPFERLRASGAADAPSAAVSVTSFAVFAYALVLVAGNGFHPFIYYRF